MKAMMENQRPKGWIKPYISYLIIIIVSIRDIFLVIGHHSVQKFFFMNYGLKYTPAL